MKSIKMAGSTKTTCHFNSNDKYIISLIYRMMSEEHSHTSLTQTNIIQFVDCINRSTFNDLLVRFTPLIFIWNLLSHKYHHTV